ncbi:hypothetical protein PR202_gb12954 [Eleusine coracana subsp. coracana]|uniref:Uncharacterized protein n=1 Tax=Eleusine coracana subsp. coracana TaxID=191504 RepID=A0AAV5ERY4_ELECO|nr:hypothetical protein PR202_gb12954 [Eleusine coracana subsp. coracana]
MLLDVDLHLFRRRRLFRQQLSVSACSAASTGATSSEGGVEAEESGRVRLVQIHGGEAHPAAQIELVRS